MLSTTAATIEDSKPVLDEVTSIMSDTLPSTLEATTDSLYTAHDAAQVLESAIQSLDAFLFLLSTTPLVGDFVEPPEESYNPEISLADSLGELASNLEGLPDTFVEMSVTLSDTDDNLDTIQENLTTMSDSVGLISSSLSEYDSMIDQSKSSLDDLKSILTGIQNNLATFLNGAVMVLSVFFIWLLSAQVVILSQGWELYQGTADQLSGEAVEPNRKEYSDNV
jgi:hypothetical protein